MSIETNRFRTWNSNWQYSWRSTSNAGCPDTESVQYNIVDRVYISRIPEVGTAALGAVGLCFPLIVIISAFANLFGTGGAPLSIFRGKKQKQLV